MRADLRFKTRFHTSMSHSNRNRLILLAGPQNEQAQRAHPDVPFVLKAITQVAAESRRTSQTSPRIREPLSGVSFVIWREFSGAR